jgi:hypothetical protein
MVSDALLAFVSIFLFGLHSTPRLFFRILSIPLCQCKRIGLPNGSIEQSCFILCIFKSFCWFGFTGKKSREFLISFEPQKLTKLTKECLGWSFIPNIEAHEIILLLFSFPHFCGLVLQRQIHFEP